MAMRLDRCIFCQSPEALTDEHIFGLWVQDYIPRTSKKFTAATDELFGHELKGPRVTRIRAGDPLNANAKIVCRICNSGWMSRVQERAKPFLLPLFKGEPCTISPEAQTAIAAWCAMVNTTGEYVSHNMKKITIRQPEKDWLRQTETAPPKWRFWLGNYARKLCTQHWFRATAPILYAKNVTDIPDSQNRPPNAQTTAFVIGKLFIVIMSSAYPQITQRWSWHNAPRARRRLCEIGSGTANSINWPIYPLPMTDSDACRFAQAWQRYSNEIAGGVWYD